MPDDLVAVYRGYIYQGKPLAIPLYSPTGVLLAEKGSILDQEQYARIYRHKLVMTPRATLIEMLDNLKLYSYTQDVSTAAFKLPATIHRILKLESEYIESLLLDPENFEERIINIVTRLDSVVSSNTNASLAKIFLRTTAYPVIEAGFSTAIIGSILTKRLEWRAKERLSFMCAAITLDLSVLVPRDKPNTLNLNPNKNEIFTPEHPTDSASLLAERNVKNARWLSYVTSHHQSEITLTVSHRVPPSSTLAYSLMVLINKFCHLILGYGYDQFLYPDVAMMALVEDDDSRYIHLFQKLMTECIGIYPPGSMVKLVGGEIALVQRNGTTPQTPFVTIIANSYGISPLQFPVIQTDTRRRAIKAMHFDPKLFRNNDFSKFWR